MFALELDFEKQYDGLLGTTVVLSSKQLKSNSQRMEGGE